MAWIALLKQSPTLASELLSQFLDEKDDFLTVQLFPQLRRYWGWKNPPAELGSEVITKLMPLITHQDSEVACQVINGLSVFSGREFLKMLQKRLVVEERYKVSRAIKNCLQTIIECR